MIYRFLFKLGLTDHRITFSDINSQTMLLTKGRENSHTYFTENIDKLDCD
jgi:hypothetical protein